MRSRQDPRIAETLQIGRNIITLYTRGKSPQQTDRLLHMTQSQRCYCLRELKRHLGARTREELVLMVIRDEIVRAETLRTAEAEMAG